MITNLIYSRLKKQKSLSKTGELHSRSFIKALSWRFIGTLDTIVISWVITGKMILAFSIGAFELMTKTVLYYFHERIWNSIKWGRKKN
ncbi:MAG TPA: DUF2061 domain-containing protein [Flavobacteriaceae bacterium]|nr:DUF2061 domain-containing protein [Flavobacteriaceae bacterium]